LTSLNNWPEHWTLRHRRKPPVLYVSVMLSISRLSLWLTYRAFFRVWTRSTPVSSGAVQSEFMLTMKPPFAKSRLLHVRRSVEPKVSWGRRKCERVAVQPGRQTRSGAGGGAVAA